MKIQQAKKALSATILMVALAIGGAALAQDSSQPGWKPPKAGESDGVKMGKPRVVAPSQEAEGVRISAPEAVQEVTPAFKGKLAFELTKFDFGTIQEGEVAEAVFPFTNTSDAKITISSVKASCGCTAVAPDKKEYLPGETGSIKAKFNSSGRDGHQTKSITVTTDEAPNANYLLELGGEVITEVYLEPRLINFGDIHADEGTTITVHFVNMTGAPINIKEAVTQRGDLNIAVQTPTEYRERDTGRVGVATPIMVGVPKGVRQGAIAGQLSVQTDNPAGQKMFSAQLRGTVLGDVNLEPETAYFGVTKPGDVVTRTVKLRMLSKEAFEFESFDVEIPAIPGKEDEVVKPDIKVEVGELANNSQEIKLTLVAPDKGGRLTGEVLLKGTSRGKEIEPVAVPFMVYVNAPHKSTAGNAPGSNAVKAGNVAVVKLGEE